MAEIKPAYRLHDDVIQMPFRHQFDSPEAFYETILHELVHWSEKENRVGSGRKATNTPSGNLWLRLELAN